MYREALSRLVAVVGDESPPELLSSSADGRVVAAFGAMVAKLGLPGEAARTAAIMNAVTQALGDQAPLVVPRLLWVRDDVLAMERLTGESFRALASGSDALAAFTSAGQGVAALHSVQPSGLMRCGLSENIRDLIRPNPAQIGVALPELSGRVGAIVQQLTDELAEPSRHVAIHRDLHLGQMFVAGSRTAVIDWDLCALGDPALDLGNLRAYLCTRLPSTADALWDAFVNGYGGRLPAGVDRYESLMYLRMASKAYRMRGLAATRRITQLVVAAEACM